MLPSPIYFNFQHDTLLFEDKATCALFQERNVKLREYDCDEIARPRHIMIKLRDGDELSLLDDLGDLDTLVLAFDFVFRSREVFEQVSDDIETYFKDRWEDAGARDEGRKPARIEFMEWRELRRRIDRM